MERIVDISQRHVKILARLRSIVLQNSTGPLADLAIQVSLGLLEGHPLERARELLVRSLIHVREALVLDDRARLLLQSYLLW